MPTLAVSFQAQPRGMEVVFDAAKQQQMLSFNLSAHVPLMDLYQALKTLGMESPSAMAHTPPDPPARPSVGVPGIELEPRKVPLSPSKSPAPAPAPTSPSKEPLLAALRHGDVAAVRRLLEKRKGELQDLAPPGAGSLLHVALESGGRLDLVKLLLEGRCSPNGVNEEGRSPLHLAVLQVNSLSPMVARLLLLARADPAQRDLNGVMPADLLKSCAGSHVSSNVKQIMSEMVAAPTQQVAVFEREQVLCACFADLRCEVVAFQTEKAVGLYDISTSQVRCRKELSSRGKRHLRALAVNPSTGGVALLLEVGATPPRDLVMFWPSGQLADEEPLKWTIEGGSSSSASSSLPPSIALSQAGYTSTSGPVILCRSCAGAVLAWRLTPMGAQLMAERTLAEENGGVVSLSFHGHWAALAQSDRLQVWAFREAEELEPWACEVVCTIERSLAAFAVIEESSPSSCLLAMTGLPDAPAQVWRVQRSGARELVYRVTPNASSNIRALSFCGEDSNALLGVLEDGHLMLCKLNEGSQICMFDDGSLRTVDISRDRCLMVSSLQECFRIFRVGSGAE